MDTAMMDGLNITHVLLSVIGFLIVYVLNGIKGEIREVRDSMNKLEKELSTSISDLDKRVALMEAGCTSRHA